MGFPSKDSEYVAEPPDQVAATLEPVVELLVGVKIVIGESAGAAGAVARVIVALSEPEYRTLSVMLALKVALPLDVGT